MFWKQMVVSVGRHCKATKCHRVGHLKMVDCVLYVFRHTKDKWARGERRDRWGMEAQAEVRVLARWGV